jgi:hypothetical protein
MQFSDLQFNPHPIGNGVVARYFFENGYGVSVVRFRGSYGYDQGLYEVAVLKGTEDDYELCYDTVLTEDVLGYQSEEEVEVLLYEVENL